MKKLKIKKIIKVLGNWVADFSKIILKLITATIKLVKEINKLDRKILIIVKIYDISIEFIEFLLSLFI